MGTSVDWTVFKCSAENLDEYATICQCSNTCPTAPDAPVPSITTLDITSIFLGVNPRKAIGPDGVPGRALRFCVNQLAEVLTDIFNLSLLQAKDHTYFKKSAINPVFKKTHPVCLNDNCAIALTSIIVKCFERLVMVHINSSLPTCLDPL
eukprot:g32037.t1